MICLCTINLFATEYLRYIEKSGKKCIIETKDKKTYLESPDIKLNEELAEYQQDKNVEELADPFEVIYAVTSAKGCSVEELEWIRIKKLSNVKRLKRGTY